MSRGAYELILCIVPAGPQTVCLVSRLTEDLGLWNVMVGRSRRAVADRRRWRSRLIQSQEMDEVTILVPAHRAEEAFRVVCDDLHIRDRGQGMVHRMVVDQAIGMALPDSGTKLEENLSTASSES